MGIEDLVQKEFEACIPVHIPTMDRTFLTLKSEWVNKFVDKEVGYVQDI